MKLVEVVVAEETADETIERSLAFVRQIGKIPIVVRDSAGFLVNRVLFPYLLDAAQLFERGGNLQEIDEALVCWGMPMGPLRLIDEIGLDVTLDIADTLRGAYGERDQPPQILREMRAAALLGRKSRAGFYAYQGRNHEPNAQVKQWQRATGPSPDDLPHRLVFLMVNEAARCLEESVVQSAEDADYGMTLGTGFAPFRGGPLRFAENFGIRRVTDEMERLAEHEEKFRPAEILKRHAQNGTKFYEDAAGSAS
jgi:3-hydroxyacyl-CoA dehydrogenase / enoyl-CoA hydratase / 3-hydroxybutyryl-CoA epimerase